MTTALTAPSRHLRPPESQQVPRKIAMLSTYPPRKCGVGAFAKELRDSLLEVAPDLEVLVCAVDREGLRYGEEVAAVLDRDDPADYRKTAGRLAALGADAVLIQHEFGIYGGPDGAWISSFTAQLAEVGVPYLATLHTVPDAPSRRQADVLRRLCRGAAAVTVASPTAQRLAEAAGVRADRFDVIPRGAPALLRSRTAERSAPGIRAEVAKALAEAEGATLVSTFGLVSVNKGLQMGIAAVAALARELPDLRYIIAGVTHPEILRRHGEDHRQSLGEQVAELRAGDHIRFLDFYLTEPEVAALLARTAVFLTPYRSRDQVCSGALTYALAAGRPVVSTSFHYARDLVTDEAGLLAEPGDTEAYTRALRRMLTEPGRLDRAAKAAWAVGAELTGPVVARRAADVIRDVAARHERRVAVEGKPPPRHTVPYQR